MSELEMLQSAIRTMTEAGDRSLELASTVTGDLMVEQDQHRLSLFAGWAFITCKAGDEESYPVEAAQGGTGPEIQYNPNLRSIEHLENPNNALDWVSHIIKDFCQQVLVSALADKESFVGELQGEGWDKFRDTMCRHCDETLETLVRDIELKGFKNTLDDVAYMVYIESGLHTALIERANGSRHLYITSNNG